MNRFRFQKLTRAAALLLALALLLGGCGSAAVHVPAPTPTEALSLVTAPAETPTAVTEAPDVTAAVTPSPDATPTPDPAPVDTEASAPLATESPAPAGEEAPALSESGSYTAPEDVAAYLHSYGRLPSNFITKNDAKALGWDSSKGNLWDVAPGKSIGGDRFGNYEGLLPEGRYRECDVNYAGGYRGGERIIYGEDGSVYYTADHYQSFTRLY